MLSCNKKHVISIFSRQIVNGQADEFKFVGTCSCCIDHKLGLWTISYDEVIDGCCTPCVIKIEGPDSISVLRNGAQSVKLIFEKNKRHLCTYLTEGVSLDFGVFVHELICDFYNDCCHIMLTYSLDTDGIVFSKNKIVIDIKGDEGHV